MELTAKNYKTVLPKELLRRAGKNKVRECDEIEKGHFVAYVDEGVKSFDVSLTILQHDEISAHSCDCKNNSRVCVHKVALLMHIMENKTIKHGIKAKSKTSKFQSVLETVELNELKEWVGALLDRNKDIELSFVNYFSDKKNQYSPDEIKKLTLEAVKAVTNNKKAIDQTQLKKIIELWTDIHKPVVDNYLANITDEKSFLNFNAVFESCSLFQPGISGTSGKIQKYLDGLLQGTTELLSKIGDETAWHTATGYFINNIHVDSTGIRMPFLIHLKNVIGVSNAERRNKLIDRLAKKYSSAYKYYNLNDTQYTKVIFGLLDEYGLFKDYYTKFKPILFDNEFNKRLIQLLIENTHYELAEKYCQEQIENNFKKEYNVPYLELLKEIYIIQNDEKNLLKILAELFPYTFNFDDFIHILKGIHGEEEKKKWRTKMFTKAASYPYSKAATEFCFKLLHHEKKYSKMIERIDSRTPNSIILTYFEQMALTDKTRLLQAIMQKANHYDWGFSSDHSEREEKYFPELVANLLKHYSATYLMLAVKQAEKNSYHFALNDFLVYLKEKLATVAKGT